MAQSLGADGTFLILDFYVLVIVMPLFVFSQEINDVIFSSCSTSPRAHHNQIAVVCRATNILWRRMHRQVVLDLLDRTIINLVEEAVSQFTFRGPFPLQDVVDII